MRRELWMPEDLEVSGRTSMGGGVYRRVEVNGMTKMLGDITCETCEVNGSAQVEGSLRAEGRIEVNGRLNVQGPIAAGALEVNGMCRVNGNCEVSEAASISGVARFEGSLRAGDIRVGGRVRVSGAMEAEAVRVTGNLRCGGLVNADVIEFELMGKSSVREIGCGTLTVAVGRGGWFSKPRLEVETIEGDRVEVEAVVARRVRGDVVIVGDDCRVDLVEYRTTFERRGAAVVGEAVQI
ncbi:polymer-forming cytoskeletal protein [Alicyclobacillus vulcanalis]|nr:polymer-forming cytoskeletal protein [Alicyclobacillus vulcanalis]